VSPDLVRIEARSRDWLTYDLPPDLVARIWKGRYRGQQQMWYLMRFLGDDGAIDIRTAHPEFSAWRWMAPDELIGRIVPFKRDVYRAVFEEFAPHLSHL